MRCKWGKIHAPSYSVRALSVPRNSQWFLDVKTLCFFRREKSHPKTDSEKLPEKFLPPKFQKKTSFWNGITGVIKWYTHFGEDSNLMQMVILVNFPDATGWGLGWSFIMTPVKNGKILYQLPAFATHSPRPIRAMRTWRYGLPLGGFSCSNVKRRELTDVHLKFAPKGKGCFPTIVFPRGYVSFRQDPVLICHPPHHPCWVEETFGGSRVFFWNGLRFIGPKSWSFKMWWRGPPTSIDKRPSLHKWWRFTFFKHISFEFTVRYNKTWRSFKL